MFGIVERVRQQRYSLRRRQQVHRKPPRIGSFANRLELRLHPRKRRREQHHRSLRNHATVLLQFGTQRSDWTATPRQPLAVFNLYLHKNREAVLSVDPLCPAPPAAS